MSKCVAILKFTININNVKFVKWLKCKLHLSKKVLNLNMATTKKVRGSTILKQMLSDKKAFKDAVQNSNNISEVVIKLDKLNKKRAKRTAV